MYMPDDVVPANRSTHVLEYSRSSGGIRGGPAPPFPFSPEIYHLILVKGFDTQNIFIFLILFLFNLYFFCVAISGVTPPPF
jgi:hypothetical protein